VIAIILFNPILLATNRVRETTMKEELTFFIEIVDVYVGDNKLSILPDVVLVDFGHFY
jgi:hypothetical protein